MKLKFTVALWAVFFLLSLTIGQAYAKSKKKSSSESSKNYISYLPKEVKVPPPKGGTTVPEYAKSTFNPSKKKSGGTISEYRPPTCQDRCNKQYQECMHQVNYKRALEGAGEFTAYIDSLGYLGCRAEKKRCSRCGEYHK